MPTVVTGIGKPGVMLSVLGKRIGAPWIYAALEKGMEAYPGQPSVRELRDIYHYDSIAKGTRFLGVTGFGDEEAAKVAAFNALFAHQQSNLRCLPLGMGSIPIFRKIMDAVKLAGVSVDPKHQESAASLATTLDADAAAAEGVDLLVPHDQGVALHGDAPSWRHWKRPENAGNRARWGANLDARGVNAAGQAIGHAAHERADYHRQPSQGGRSSTRPGPRMPFRAMGGSL